MGNRVYIFSNIHQNHPMCVLNERAWGISDVGNLLPAMEILIPSESFAENIL